MEKVRSVAMIRALATFFVLAKLPSTEGLDPLYHFQCNRTEETIGGHVIENRCVKTTVMGNEKPIYDMNGCKMVCGPFGALWPQPTGHVNLSTTLVTDLSPDDFLIRLEAPSNASIKAVDELKRIFRENLLQMHPRYQSGKVKAECPFARAKSSSKMPRVSVRLRIADPKITSLRTDTDESYSLHLVAVEKEKRFEVSIEAETFFGSRHGLETLSQLVSFNQFTGMLQMHRYAEITNDKPKYPHRGLLIDTSRNFFALETLKRMVDGLSYSKMNVLHWHITDSSSFPMEVKSVPELTRWGAYSAEKVYTHEDITELIEYARIRGVKVVPEFDAPAHAGNGWQFAEELHPEWGRLAVCVNREEWQDYCVEPPCGQLNVLNEKTYEVLGKVYGEMSQLFDSDLFHMGGDEINFNCWNTSKEFTDYMADNGKVGTKEDYLERWKSYQSRAFGLLTDFKPQTAAILWSNSFTEENVDDYLNNKDYVIQLWTKGNDHTIKDVIDKGYRTIFSPHDAWYLDCGYSAWVGSGNNWCSPYKGWQVVYDFSPKRVYQSFPDAIPGMESNIMGGEACMWSEQVQGLAVEGKLWPRGAALGERLWSDPETGWKEAEDRINVMRKRMVDRGIHADGLQPEWCLQNEALCYERK